MFRSKYHCAKCGRNMTHNSLISTDSLYKHKRDGFSELDTDKYPREKYKISYFDVKTDKGSLDAVQVSPTGVDTDKTMIKFCGSGHNYQEAANIIVDEALEFNCNVISANYPGVTRNDYHAASKYDYTNVGIALIKHVMESKQMSVDKLADNVILDGYSMGGFVAMSVAHYFKTQYNVDVPVFVDRAPSNLAICSANIYNKYSELPMCMGEKLNNYYCYGAGDLTFHPDMDYAALNHDKVDFINVKDDPIAPESISFTSTTENPVAHYFEYLPESNNEVKEVNTHILPRQSIFQSEKIESGKKVSAQEYFG